MGTGTIASRMIGSDPHEYLVNLTGVTNRQHLVINLTNVQDVNGNTAASVFGTLHLLIGDTNGNTFVNAADVAQTKSRLGQAVNTTNFRSDVNANGAINAADTSIVKANSGTSLPP
jgi:hypothetical protein